MLDDTLPLTPPEWPEWGNPIERKDFRTILSLFALRQHRGEAISAVLAMGGLTDPRVTCGNRPSGSRDCAQPPDRGAARYCFAPTWAPAMAAPSGLPAVSTKSRSRLRSRCGQWEWRRRWRSLAVAISMSSWRKPRPIPRDLSMARGDRYSRRDRVTASLRQTSPWGYGSWLSPGR